MGENLNKEKYGNKFIYKNSYADTRSVFSCLLVQKTSSQLPEGQKIWVKTFPF